MSTAFLTEAAARQMRADNDRALYAFDAGMLAVLTVRAPQTEERPEFEDEPLRRHNEDAQP